MEPRSTPAAGPARLRAVAGQRLRTLPDRHGGPLVLALIALTLVAGFGLRLAAALDPPAGVGNDAEAYMAIARALYEDGRYGSPAQSSPTDWSPGAPLLYGAVYYLVGGVRPEAVLLLLAVLGLATMLFVYLIARRLGGPVAGLFAAVLAASYPSFVENTQRMLAEPVAMFTLTGTVLAFLWASDGGRLWRWLLPGLGLGATALTRPEYVPFVAVFGLLALVRVAWLHRAERRRSALLKGCAAAALLAVAFAVPLAPWTARNYVVLDRFVPVTTGGGKALFVATYLPAEGRQQRVKAMLIERYYGKRLSYPEVKATEMAPLLNRVAKRYPDLNRDAALARIARENFRRYLTGQPWAYAQMVLAKVGNMWDRGSTPVMSTDRMFVYHRVLIALAIVGFAAMLAWRRWEAVVIGLLVLGVTVVGGLTLAVPRRALPLMPLVLCFAALPPSWIFTVPWRRRAPTAADSDAAPASAPPPATGRRAQPVGSRG